MTALPLTRKRLFPRRRNNGSAPGRAAGVAVAEREHLVGLEEPLKLREIEHRVLHGLRRALVREHGEIASRRVNDGARQTVAAAEYDETKADALELGRGNGIAIAA